MHIHVHALIELPFKECFDCEVASEIFGSIDTGTKNRAWNALPESVLGVAASALAGER